ncbi:D-cysteine desulfhydrase family protein [Lutispora sp.]|uniref:D-cysteine desulfhydrase family protein n=1 Tax=Lutispora sp. TaxID=2828727 RepID=UPI002B21227A|nr:D-cysteine desulfhydrase family protein [Lutispora sp.]MEA4962644.1 D-cysteine desulfhydrase family protein [Lutispora sp.]
MDLRNKMKLANLPTRIERLEKLSKELGKNIYIKRDDQTGTEVSGNKVRKLEFAVKEALDNNCDYLITCGGIQSNHARATAAVAAKLGMGSYLVLRGKADNEPEGNLFLDKILGAKIKFITAEEYRDHRTEIMESIKAQLFMEGHEAYILPEGASNGVGSLGYYNALLEILDQEKDIGVKFDAIVSTVGSGGTYAGLYYGNKVTNNDAVVYGINIAGDREYFQNIIEFLLHETIKYTKQGIVIDKDDINIIDGYSGLGYALSRPEEIKFIQQLASVEGVILDPVYTGKAMYGLVQEIKKGRFDKHNNILFIHTGGLFGWNSIQREMIEG